MASASSDDEPDDSIETGVFPEEEPGVDDGTVVPGVDLGAGCPFPGVRFVEQPKAAIESVSVRAATPRPTATRKRLCFCSLAISFSLPDNGGLAQLLRAMDVPQTRLGTALALLEPASISRRSER